MTTEEKIKLLKTICWNCSGSMNVEIFDSDEFSIRGLENTTKTDIKEEGFLDFPLGNTR
jgi:hypothetical protein